MENILIFGGTFDPPHFKHYRILETLSNIAWIKKIVIVPALQNPNKNWTPLFSYKTRLKLLSKTLEEFGRENYVLNTKISIDNYFSSRKELNYIGDYVQNLSINKSNIWVYLPSDYYKWQRFDKVLQSSDNFVTVLHEFDSYISSNYFDEIDFAEKKILFIKANFKFADISSSYIRKCIINKDINMIQDGLVAPYVKKFIRNFINKQC